jgi:hypothetical protein
MAYKRQAGKSRPLQKSLKNPKMIETRPLAQPHPTLKHLSFFTGFHSFF